MKRAVVVGDGHFHAETALGALAAAGCEAVTVPTITAARASVEAGALVVVVGARDGMLPAEQAAPLLAMPPALRRGCVLVLVGDGVTTADGVDLVVAGGDLSRLGELVAAALAAKRSLVGQIDPAAAARLGA
jgi:hypothetical protein